MKILLSYVTTVLLLLSSYHVIADELWTDMTDGFGAQFPNPPERVSVATAKVAAYAYQSTKSFKGGGALYAITVTPMPTNIGKEKLNTYLEKANSGFIEAMGQKPRKAKVGWVKFGDGRNQLNYAFNYNYNGSNIKTRGFWIVDKLRTVRVSVTYLNGISSHNSRNIISFLDSFVLLLNSQ